MENLEPKGLPFIIELTDTGRYLIRNLRDNAAKPATETEVLLAKMIVELEKVGDRLPKQEESSPEPEPSLLNLNTATKAALTSIKGVGAKTAAAIIEERDKNGLFESLENFHDRFTLALTAAEAKLFNESVTVE